MQTYGFSDEGLTLLVVYICTDLAPCGLRAHTSPQSPFTEVVVRVLPTKPTDTMADQPHNPFDRSRGPRVADRPTDIMADQPHNPFIEEVE